MRGRRRSRGVWLRSLLVENQMWAKRTSDRTSPTFTGAPSLVMASLARLGGCSMSLQDIRVSVNLVDPSGGYL